MVAALALTSLLVNAYGRRSRAGHWVASLALGVTVVCAALAVVGNLSYGISGDARAAVVWRAGTLRSISPLAIA